MGEKLMRHKKIGRNDLCHCGSGLKLKRCHGDFVKIEVAGRAYQAKFNELIEAEKSKKVEVPPEFNELHGDPVEV